MSRPVTLFTGQWADLPLEELAPLAKEMGFDGLELACWGDHMDVDKAAKSKKYCKEKHALLANAYEWCNLPRGSLERSLSRLGLGTRLTAV